MLFGYPQPHSTTLRNKKIFNYSRLWVIQKNVHPDRHTAPISMKPSTHTNPHTIDLHALPHYHAPHSNIYTSTRIIYLCHLPKYLQWFRRYSPLCGLVTIFLTRRMHFHNGPLWPMGDLPWTAPLVPPVNSHIKLLRWSPYGEFPLWEA